MKKKQLVVPVEVYSRVIRNSKNIFLTDNGMIGFQGGINLIFSLIIEGDNMVFSPLRSENDLFKKTKLI